MTTESGGTGGTTADGPSAGGATAGGATAGGASATTTGGSSAAAAPAWHGLTEAADIAYIGNKGWQTPADVIKSYRGAESLIGRDPNQLLVMPRADDPAGFRSVMSKLGLPAEAAGYKLEMPEGTDPKYSEWAKGAFHKVGLTGNQASELVKMNNEFAAQAEATRQADYQRTLSTQKAELLSDWKGGYERQMNAAQMAVKALGFSEEIVNAIEENIGYKETMKFLAGLGKRVSEDSFVGAEGGPGSGFGASMTREEATAEWTKMRSDPVDSKALTDKSHPRHDYVNQKKRELFDIMYAE